jgi:hypothetical protein
MAAILGLLLVAAGTAGFELPAPAVRMDGV